MDYIKKAVLTLITLATLYGCAKMETYSRINESGNEMEISLITNTSDHETRSRRDSVIRISKSGSDKFISYVNVVPSNKNLPEKTVDKICVGDDVYNRCDEDLDSLFAEGDSIYRNSVDFVKAERKKELEQKINEVLYK